MRLKAALLSLLSLASIFAMGEEVDHRRRALLSLEAGIYNVTGTHLRSLYQIEYKWKPVVADLRPQIGFFVAENWATYLYGGIAYDLFLGKHVALTPSFSPGLYAKGKGKDLGFPLEFRSCLELAFIFNNGARLGAEIYHLSNAHLSSKNPGVNEATLFYSIPL
jgi:lipid A 3-O-deacylase